MDNNVLEIAYVINILNDEYYFTANTGLYKTRKGAEKECKRLSRIYDGIYELKVQKVALVMVEEDEDE